ncbi:hypothetical protein ABPG75_002525 [Micractinium tetrahymenae]
MQTLTSRAPREAEQPPAKRLRLQLPPKPPQHSSPAAARADCFFSGVKVFVPTSGVPFGSTRARLWKASLERCGGSLTQDPKEAASVTHVVAGDGGIAALPPQLQPGGSRPANSSSDRPKLSAAAAAASRSGSGSGPGGKSRAASGRVYVSHGWVERSLAKGRLLPPADFPPPDPAAEVPTPTGAAGRPASRTSESWGSLAGSAAASGGSKRSASRAAGGSEAERCRRWLGEELWHPGCQAMSLTELALQAVYSEERSRRIGNEPVVQALRELSKYERALHPDYFEEQQQGAAKKDVMNHRALRYSRAAAVVRACSYRLRPDLRAGDLPFIGEATADQINDIIETGTCAALDRFRVDEAVLDSKGKRRNDSVGGATRARFHSLPEVGQRAAKRWWDLGCRSFEDVELAAEPGGLLGPGGLFPLSPEQRFSLRHRADLLEGTTEEEVREMLETVSSGLEAASGRGGWRCELVGGGRRSSAVHDADFLITHLEHPVAGAILQLRDHLVAQGRLVPPGEAMVQEGQLPTHLEKLRTEHLQEASAAPSRETMDKRVGWAGWFDRIYGMYRTKRGKVRRLDVIICPPEEWAFGLVGWTGSRQYLRFMRQHAKDSGMFLSSHRLLRKVGSESLIVPDEAPPLDRAGQERWPPGWGPGRRVETEADLFELLAIPYRQPHERNAP